MLVLPEALRAGSCIGLLVEGLGELVAVLGGLLIAGLGGDGGGVLGIVVVCAPMKPAKQKNKAASCRFTYISQHVSFLISTIVIRAAYFTTLHA